MARRNLSRALGAAALVMLSGGGALLGTPVPAGAAKQILVTISDAGFSQREIKAEVGDFVVFQLDTTSTRDHTVTLRIDDREVEFDFSQRDENSWTLPPFKNGGAKAVFYDRYNIRRPDWRAFVGTIEVDEAPEPDPSSTTTSSTATTVTTAPTTTTTAPPTTSTTAPGTIRPQLVPDPPPTSTTTMAPLATLPPAGEATPPPGDKGKDKEKDKPRDKDKSKAAAAGTPTTEAPADPNAVPPDSLFDPAFLTPSPVSRPDGWGYLGDGEVAALDAAALADLLHPAASTEADDDDSRLTMYAVGALALLVLGSAAWGWQHRSSRYFPA